MALSAEYDSPRREPSLGSGPIAANVKVYNGALVVLDSSGSVRPGRASTTDKVLGRARGTFDNTSGSAAALTVEFEKGIFRYENSSSGDAIAQDDVGKTAYVVDDCTVALTSNSSA